jgi:hypothetical protein
MAHYQQVWQGLELVDDAWNVAQIPYAVFNTPYANVFCIQGIA